MRGKRKRPGRGERTNKVNDSVCHAKGASSLDTPAELDNVCAQLPGSSRSLLGVGVAIGSGLETGKVVGGQVDEAGANRGADEVLGLDVLALLGNLHLELAATEAEVHHHVAAAALGALTALDSRGQHAGLVLADLVPSRDSEVDAALPDKGRDIGGREEDEGNGEVLDEGEVEAVLASELDIGALEEIERGLIEASLWISGGWIVSLSFPESDASFALQRGDDISLLGTAKSSRPSRLCDGSAIPRPKRRSRDSLAAWAVKRLGSAAILTG